jgi:uroporphyrinogen-III synthase
MIRILSTKKLLPNQKQFMLNAGFSIVEADFIKIKNNHPKLNNIKDNLIFTSQNAVRSILEYENPGFLKTKNCFCVGIKTKALLEENGFKVIIFSDYASDLAGIISKDYRNEKFTFFSGNLRKDELPEMLKKAHVDSNEIEVYETVLEPKKIKTPADGILFFSPSGVESFLKENNIKNESCFCIGKTTAKALENITTKMIIANQPSVENLIIQVINHYKKD